MSERNSKQERARERESILNVEARVPETKRERAREGNRARERAS